MTESEDKRFDLQIRSVLGNAREEVPEGLYAKDLTLALMNELERKRTERG